jgi:hypothetical protein
MRGEWEILWLAAMRPVIVAAICCRPAASNA